MSTLPSSMLSRATTYRAGMLLMADRLFAEFDRVPVRLVLDAIACAHRTLRERGVLLPPPGEVEALARETLRLHLQAA